MKRFQLEHIIRAGGSIADDEEIIVLGSSSILAQFPNISEEVLLSIEADVFPKNRPDMADLIDGSICELSPFHQAFGYYAHGVGKETAGFFLSEMKILEVLLAGAWKSTTWPLENTLQGEKKTISLFLRLLPMEW